MPMVFEDNKWILVCASCSTKHPQAWQQRGTEETCSSCGVVRDESPRDALGQKIRIPTDKLGKFSYAYGEVINSSHQASRLCKESGLALRKA